MKKTFLFKAEEDKYILQDKNPSNKKEPFEISKKEMLFNTNKFYEYVFADIESITDIVFEDVSDGADKVAKRVFATIEEITKGVMEKMNEKCF